LRGGLMTVVGYGRGSGLVSRPGAEA
jgi:hypothetical protein